MRISTVEILRYDLPLARPLTVKGKAINTRSGMIIRLGDADGHVGYGEAAPLPGFHNETIANVIRQLLDIKPFLTDAQVPNDVRYLQGAFGKWLRGLPLLPTVRYGIELAALNLTADSKGMLLHELIGDSFHNEVVVNGLLSGSAEAVLQQAEELTRAGYRSIKLKVGRGSVSSDAALVKQVRSVINEDVSLRLDANCALTLAEAVRFGKLISRLDIEYIEEPLKNCKNLGRFYEQTGIGIALDESLSQIFQQDLKKDPGTKAIVLKPCFAGGLEETVRYIRWAVREGIAPVLSSAFNSGIALAGLAQIAAVFTPKDIAMGLDTFRWLQQDLLVKPFDVSCGSLDVRQIGRATRNIRTDLLRSEVL